MVYQHVHPLPPPPPPSSPSSSSSFPILAISILGILTTAILLLSYYIFVIKCCFNRSDVLSRLSRSRRRNFRFDPAGVLFSSARETRGLEESAIRAIPTFRFRGVKPAVTSSECAVCLNEFQEDESIRILPNCYHLFHIDCIDTWLQTNANCPLCRGEIVANTMTTILADQFMAEAINDHNEDVVIEVRGEGGQATARQGRKLKHVCSMGDECIDVRGGDERLLAVQPMRRSFSMDSSSDHQLRLVVQEIMKQNPGFKEVESGEGCSSNGGGRARRAFFSFGHGRSSRSSVTPVEIEL